MKRILNLFSIIIVFYSCSGNPNQNTEKYVLATTTIAADVVSSIAGNGIHVESLLPAGASPHSFEPTPQDLAKVADASIIFINGLGLEGFIAKMIKASGTKAKIIDLSTGIAPRTFDEKAAQPDHSDDEDDDHHHKGSGDPHVWFDPHNVMIWTQTIEMSLIEAFPDQKEILIHNSLAYIDTLLALDQYILETVSGIPTTQRKLITDHMMFGYFADRYGFEQAGAIIPGYNSLAEPSAADIARLETTIKKLNIPAIFVGNTVNPVLSKRIADDTGTRLITFYTGSLGAAGSPAATYPAYIRYNTKIIAEGLK